MVRVNSATLSTTAPSPSPSAPALIKAQALWLKLLSEIKRIPVSMLGGVSWVTKPSDKPGLVASCAFIVTDLVKLPTSRLLARNNFQTFRIHAIEEITRLAIINRGCLGLMAMGWRKEGLNGFLQVASAELPILDRAYEPLSVGVGIGR